MKWMATRAAVIGVHTDDTDCRTLNCLWETIKNMAQLAHVSLEAMPTVANPKSVIDSTGPGSISARKVLRNMKHN